MKLRFQKDDIVNGISIVMKAVPSKTTMSILECILIDASSGEIKLTGNDMELGIETTVNGEILEHGKIALDAKLFSEITRRVSSQNAVVTIESDDKFNTTISCENSVFNIQGRDGDEFSYIPYIEKNKYKAAYTPDLFERFNGFVFIFVYESVLVFHRENYIRNHYHRNEYQSVKINPFHIQIPFLNDYIANIK